MESKHTPTSDAILTIDAPGVHDAMQHPTSPHNRAGGEGASKSGNVGQREDACSAVSGKFLARAPAQSSWHQRRRHRPDSPRPQATGTSGALLSASLRFELTARPASEPIGDSRSFAIPSSQRGPRDYVAAAWSQGIVDPQRRPAHDDGKHRTGSPALPERYGPAVTSDAVITVRHH
jgi:hypothetical protein